jgi:hypothetical protein
MAEENNEKPLARLGHGGTTHFLRLLAWTPRWLRWDSDADASHELTWGMCIVFGVVCHSHFHYSPYVGTAYTSIPLSRVEEPLSRDKERTG